MGIFSRAFGGERKTDVLSQGCAQVPFKLYRERETNGLPTILPAKDHALYDLVTVQPNAWTTSFQFRETLVLHAALGNAYVFINRSSFGITELTLLDPAKVVKEQKNDYSIVYKVTGLAITTEETHAKLHAKGVRPSGTYSVESTLNKEQYAALKSWIEREFAGAENSGTPMILDRGAKWMSQGMSGVDAQHIETRKHQVEEVCRFFGIFPIMIGYSDKTSTFASSEAFFDAHVKHSLAPWFARIEQSADAYWLLLQI